MARCAPASVTRRRRSCPTTPIFDRAADILNAGKKVAILVGAGALGAADEVIAVADRLSARAAPRRCSARPCCPTTCHG